jgi:hypothetical protein
MRVGGEGPPDDDRRQNALTQIFFVRAAGISVRYGAKPEGSLQRRTRWFAAQPWRLSYSPTRKEVDDVATPTIELVADETWAPR